MNLSCHEAAQIKAGEETSEESRRVVLFLLFPESSAFNASFPLARRLKGIGYRVIYAGVERFRDYVQAQGLEYETLEPENSSPQREAVMSPSRGIARWLRLRADVKEGRKTLDGWFDRGEQYLRAVKPAVVLLDPLIWRFALVPLKCGTPIVGFSTALAGAFNPAVPPAFCDLQPLGLPVWRSRLRHTLAWAKCVVPLWWRIVVMEHVLPWGLLLPPQRSSIARIRRAGGQICWGEYGPRLDVPELVAAPRAFDFEAAASTSRRIYLGTCVDVSRDDGTFDGSWLIDGKPLLYCSLGTYSHVYRHARQLFDAVIAALKKREDLQAVIQIGTCAEVDAFGPLPDRIRVVKRAPQLDILARAAVFVTHGGLSSVREAIYFGVPMFVFPCWNDQPGNAARVVRHQLGLKGDIAQVDEAAVTHMLEEMGKPSFANGMSRMREVFLRQMDGQEGLEYIHTLIQKRSSPRQPWKPRHGSGMGVRESADIQTAREQ